MLTINSNACDFKGCCTSLPKWGFETTTFNIYEGQSHSGKMKGKITRVQSKWLECDEDSSYWTVDFPEKANFQQKVIILLSVKVLDMAYFD